MKKVLLIFLIPLLITLLGVGGFIFLKKQAKEAEHKAPQNKVQSVETVVAESQTMPIKITATGSVMAAKQVVLAPEVSGKIVKLSDKLIPGTHVKKGDVIAKIDPRDFKLAVTQEQSRVHQAELDLKLEHGRGEVAEHEWKMIAGQLGEGETVSQLALRQPQLEVAKQQTESAKSGLQRAQLNLKRTIIKAPFNSMVLTKNVDLGQLVGPNTPVATLMGTDELWVNVSIPVEQLNAIDIPGINAETGSLATITQRIGAGEPVKRTGRVIRLQGELDGQNRTAKLLVSIKNPFDLENNALPLLAGAYVEVTILGREFSHVFELPRESLREGTYVWLVHKDTLKRADVEIAWKNQNSIVVASGLKPDDVVVTSPLSFPLEGMRVNKVDTTAKNTESDNSTPLTSDSSSPKKNGE